MDFKKFLLYLSGVTILAILLHLILMLSDVLLPYKDFSILSIVFFVSLCLVFYFLGQIVSKSSNLYLFNGLVAFIVITKMTFCTGLIIIYFRKMHPADKYFVIPFFIYYLVYTGFELYFMSKFTSRKL